MAAVPPQPHLDVDKPLSVVIFGATGDLAKKKLFPALYQLVLLGHFPRHVNIVGYGRKAVVLSDFLATQCGNVKERPEYSKDEYLSRISFFAGAYDQPDAFASLDQHLKALEGTSGGNRLFFLSIPPFIFGSVCQMISFEARAAPGFFTHLIIEKPFGRDSATFEELNSKTSALFKEEELYRIDHYLGKEVVLNLMTMRFSNQIFEPMWCNKYIESVEILWKEDLGTGGRGGYYDEFGIIRDIMQNHLLQVLIFLGMEPPRDLSTAAVIESKVAFLEAIETLTLQSGVLLGQFTSNTWELNGKTHSEPGYLDDQTVPRGSKCPTFAALVMKVNNERWEGVPFIMRAGKGLDERLCEVRVRFKAQRYNNLLCDTPKGNELVMRIQPDEAIYFKTMSKQPGLTRDVKETVMDMSYKTQFEGAYVGDAYERMFLNAARGDGALFVSAAELVEAWRIFTPLLHEIDNEKPDPVLYPFGSQGPVGLAAFLQQHANIHQTENWREFVALHAGDCNRLKELFEELDTDKSGRIDRAELTVLAKRFYDGRTPSELEVSKIMAMLCTDGSGTITAQDLMRGAYSLRTAFGIPEHTMDYTGWGGETCPVCHLPAGPPPAGTGSPDAEIGVQTEAPPPSRPTSAPSVLGCRA
eukprot:TRINITY_DN114654_c0_g1_i1.p1 TRINITY_DN114654_c0_g1~~TRINITY_DN114654_c0_g1_i1.p1  ORF type:complete len:641 (+),score=180.71 TRINITY_DN114654_c0_g1_i1:66-1988(+)